jgi:hypothetical protein
MLQYFEARIGLRRGWREGLKIKKGLWSDAARQNLSLTGDGVDRARREGTVDSINGTNLIPLYLSSLLPTPIFSILHLINSTSLPTV